MKAMAYEMTGSTKVKDVKGAKKWHLSKELEEVSTGRILFYLVVRHRYVLVTVWAVIITLLYLFPFLPDLIFSMF